MITCYYNDKVDNFLTDYANIEINSVVIEIVYLEKEIYIRRGH